MRPTIKEIKDLYRSYMNLSSNQKILEEKNRRANKYDRRNQKRNRTTDSFR